MEKEKPKWTDKGMFWTNVVLVIATVLLFSEATTESKHSETSSTAAVNAVKEQKKYDSQSLAKQDSVLNEYRREFESLNRPYLEIAAIKFKNFEVGDTTIITYQIINLGNQPVKILTEKTAFATDTLNYVNKLKNAAYIKNKNRTPINFYASKDHPIDSEVYLDTLSQGCYNQVVKGKYFFYMFGDIQYINLITGDTNGYRFNVEIIPNKSNRGRKESSAGCAMITNDNYPIINKKKIK